MVFAKQEICVVFCLCDVCGLLGIAMDGRGVQSVAKRRV